MHFSTKSYLKSNRYHTVKHTFIVLWIAFKKKLDFLLILIQSLIWIAFLKKIKLPIEINTIFKI